MCYRHKEGKDRYEKQTAEKLCALRAVHGVEVRHAACEQRRAKDQEQVDQYRAQDRGLDDAHMVVDQCDAAQC